MPLRSSDRSRDPLWRKTPLLMLRFPALFVALALGAFLLAATVASYPVFVSSTASAALDERLEEANRFSAGLNVLQNGHLRIPAEFRRRYEDFTGRGFEADSGLDLSDEAEPVWQQRASVLETEVGSSPHLAEPIATVIGPEVEVALRAGDESLAVRLLSRTGALEHLRQVAVSTDVGGDGIWLADTVATSLGIDAGDIVILSAGDRSSEVAVAGIYEALARRPIPTPYWSSLINDIYPPAPGFAVPPAFAITGDGLLETLGTRLRQNQAGFAWEVPLRVREPLTLPDARRLRDRFDEVQATFAKDSSKLARAFFCTGYCLSNTRRVTVGENLTPTIAEAQRTTDAVTGPIGLLTAAGVLVALAVVASAAVFSVARREVETTLLSARGSGALWFGAKSGAEALLPVAAGATAGAATAIASVVALGPGAVDGDALSRSVLFGLASIPVAVALIGASAGVAFLRRSETGTSRLSTLARIPWELAVLAIAAWCFRTVAAGGGLVSGARSVDRPSVYLLLFPIAFLAGFGGLAARSLRPLLRGMAAVTRRAGDAPYLALHRLAAAKQIATLLVTACVLALGLLAYAQTVATSLAATLDAKSRVFVGSDVQAEIPATQEIPAGFPLPATKVTKVPDAAETEAREPVDILAIDPATFADAAFWDPSFSATPLGDMLDELTAGTAGLPIVLVGAGEAAPATIEMAGGDVAVDVVAHARNFPGISESDPGIVASTEAMEAYFERTGGINPLTTGVRSTEAWFRGDADAVAAAAGRADLPLGLPVAADEVARNPSIAAVGRTFQYLRLLGGAAGLLAAAATIMYLQARQRKRVVSYALSRRMGLGHASHRVAVLIETASLLLSSFLVAALLAIVAARIVIPHIEPLKAIPPEALFVVPVTLLASVGVALAAASLLGAIVTDRATARADFAEVMRVGI